MIERSPLSPASVIDHEKLLGRISRHWDDQIVPQLVDYVRIPAKSPGFDRDWAKNGHIDAAVALAEKWVRAQRVPGLALELVRIGDRTPVLFFDIPATGGLDNGRSVL